MSASRCTGLALGFAVALVAGACPILNAAFAETPAADAPATAPAATRPNDEQTPSVQPPADAALKPTIAPATVAPDCAARTDLLGVSRIVEVDATTGPSFGDQYTKTEPKFLEDGEIVLTFDDGPMRRYTLPILDALDEQCTKATFFSVGRMAIADPTTLQEVARRGHTIGSHTWSHKKLTTLGADAMKYEVEMGLSAVAMAAGTPIAPFFRLPYLAHNKAAIDYLQSRGLGNFGIHVDSRDFRTRSPGVVLRNVLTQLEHEKKGIILFHDIQPSTAGALASLLAELKTRGFKVVHMVPKHAPVTLPQYDAIVEKSLRAKAMAAANDPMVTRAMTWPVTGAAPPAGTPGATAGAPPAPPQGAQAAGKTGAARNASAKRTPRPYDWANPSDDPWQLNSFGK